MFVTVDVSFNAYACHEVHCHEVHFVAKFIWSQTYVPKSSRVSYVPKSSRHEVTFHQFTATIYWVLGNTATHRLDRD